MAMRVREFGNRPVGDMDRVERRRKSATGLLLHCTNRKASHSTELRQSAATALGPPVAWM
ncbi:hypothetical protein CFAM422_009445 [Trichoderma lentiforme]|uniref:Uncharacterized protein n=1 Tax=Trichoderma lentiforme TaxID=1567552 RepID=A0A9P4XAF6_9HYPO|nr:hypothetical protein CFAM422_009445 [Trichoderma lentiforme]